MADATRNIESPVDSRHAWLYDETEDAQAARQNVKDVFGTLMKMRRKRIARQAGLCPVEEPK